MFKVKLTARARKELKEISKVYQEAIELAFLELAEDPFIGKPLTRELTGRFTYKVGLYRIIYIINKKDKILIIISAGHRSTIYL